MAFTVVGPPPHPPLGVPRAAAVGDLRQNHGVPRPGILPVREAVAAAQLGLAGGLPAVPAGRMGGFPRAGADLGAQTHPQAEVGVGLMGRRVEHRGVRRGVQAAGAFPRSAASALGVEGDHPDPTYTCLPTCRQCFRPKQNHVWTVFLAQTVKMKLSKCQKTKRTAAFLRF